MIKELLEKWNQEGLPLPMAKDSAQNKPSATLLFAYISFFLASFLITYLFFKGENTTATTLAITMAITYTILYMIRALHKAKIDLDNKSIDLESEEEPTPKEGEGK